MRTQTFISSMVGIAAAMSVAGSAMAGVIYDSMPTGPVRSILLRGLRTAHGASHSQDPTLPNWAARSSSRELIASCPPLPSR